MSFNVLIHHSHHLFEFETKGTNMATLRFYAFKQTCICEERHGEVLSTREYVCVCLPARFKLGTTEAKVLKL